MSNENTVVPQAETERAADSPRAQLRRPCVGAQDVDANPVRHGHVEDLAHGDDKREKTEFLDGQDPREHHEKNEHRHAGRDVGGDVERVSGPPHCGSRRAGRGWRQVQRRRIRSLPCRDACGRKRPEADLKVKRRGHDVAYPNSGLRD